jgi:hypothetical protein
MNPPRDKIVTKIKVAFGEMWLTSSGREHNKQELTRIVEEHEPKLVDRLPGDPLIVSIGYLPPDE